MVPLSGLGLERSVFGFAFLMFRQEGRGSVGYFWRWLRRHVSLRWDTIGLVYSDCRSVSLVKYVCLSGGGQAVCELDFKVLFLACYGIRDTIPNG